MGSDQSAGSGPESASASCQPCTSGLPGRPSDRPSLQGQVRTALLKGSTQHKALSTKHSANVHSPGHPCCCYIPPLVWNPRNVLASSSKSCNPPTPPSSPPCWPQQGAGQEGFPNPAFCSGRSSPSDSQALGFEPCMRFLSLL